MAGGAQGIGEAYTRYAAARGLNVVVVDISRQALDSLSADIGPFYKPDSGLQHELTKIAVNVTGPLLLSYHFARPMLLRKTGGIILMSSGAGMQGSPYYGHYSATKAYSLTLAESLWGEFKPYNVNVLACIAGMTMSTAAQSYAHLDTTDFQTTTELVDEIMAALGEKCSLVAGEINRENRKFMEALSREQQVDIIGQHAIDSFFDGKVPTQNI